MLIELDKVRNKERLRAAWLKDAVHAVSGHLVEGNFLSKEMKKLWDECRRRSKSKVTQSASSQTSWALSRSDGFIGMTTLVDESQAREPQTCSNTVMCSCWHQRS